MELTNIAKTITERILELRTARDELKNMGEAKAQTIAEYDKAMATTLVKLKNGVSFQVDNTTIANPPATIMDKIARGICWKEALEKERAEAGYKSLITAINAIQSEINAYQSINRHLDEY